MVGETAGSLVKDSWQKALSTFSAPVYQGAGLPDGVCQMDLLGLRTVRRHIDICSFLHLIVVF